jgi:hypothetical protein
LTLSAPSGVRILVFLHVLTMFGAVAVAGGGDFVMRRIAQTRDGRAIRTAFDVYGRIARLIPILFGIGLVLGVVAIFAEGFNPFAPWLLLAYPLFIAGMLVGYLGIGRWGDRVFAAATATGDSASAELEAAVTDWRGRVALLALWALIAAIVFVMIIKPFA